MLKPQVWEKKVRNLEMSERNQKRKSEKKVRNLEISKKKSEKQVHGGGFI